MANNKVKEEKIRKEKERRFNKVSGKIRYYSIAAMVCMVVLLLLLNVSWAYIYNTDIAGAEVSISGLNCLFSGLTGNYTSSDAIYGDMAVPFYYYAPKACENLCVITVVAMVFFVLLLVTELVTVITKRHMLNVVSTVLGLLLAAMLFVCFAIALGMSDSKILSVYCNGNPACVIYSLAIIPAILSVGITAIHGVAAFKYFELKILSK